MKFFPVAIVSWNEPAGYSYSQRKPFGLSQGLTFTVILLIVVLRARSTSWWMVAIFVVLATGITVAPWIHHRWPKLFPLSGPRVTLYDDRIGRIAGKSQVYIAFDNIESCVYWNEKDAEAEYWVLRFKPKSAGVFRSFFGVLAGTAIENAQTFEQVVLALRVQNIPVTQRKVELASAGSSF